jgi:hypothetical protein
VLREASERLTLGQAQTAQSAALRARLIAAHQKAEAGTQPISRVMNQQKCLDTLHQHLFDLKPTEIRSWIEGVLSG